MTKIKEYKITFQLWSDFQEDILDDVMNAIMYSLDYSFTERHKDNQLLDYKVIEKEAKTTNKKSYKS